MVIRFVKNVSMVLSVCKYIKNIEQTLPLLHSELVFVIFDTFFVDFKNQNAWMSSLS